MRTPGVPLRHYLENHPGWGVLFFCNHCQLSWVVEIGQVVAGLKARGLGDEGTGIRAVAALLRRPCRRCGAVDYETRPERRAPPGLS